MPAKTNPCKLLNLQGFTNITANYLSNIIAATEEPEFLT